MSVSLEERLEAVSAVAVAAKAKADLADQRVSGHEELCAERYNNIKLSISDVQNIIKWAAATITLSILGVLGWLTVQQLDMTKERIDQLESHQEASKDTPVSTAK